MYVKDSVIEAEIETDLQKERLKGMIEEVEHELLFMPDDGSSRRSSLENRLNELKGELKLLRS